MEICCSIKGNIEEKEVRKFDMFACQRLVLLFCVISGGNPRQLGHAESVLYGFGRLMVSGKLLFKIDNVKILIRLKLFA